MKLKITLSILIIFTYGKDLVPMKDRMGNGFQSEVMERYIRSHLLQRLEKNYALVEVSIAHH